MKKYFLIVLFIFGLVQIPAQTNSFPNNGRGIRFGVLLPVGADFSESDKWILSYSQAILTNNFSKYTSMTIIDKQNIDWIIDEQIKSLSGNYSEETEVLIGHMIDSEYDLYGTIRKIPGNLYSLSFSVTHKESGQRIASFLENSSLLQIHRTTVLNKASVTLMEQMGITLTTTNRQALLTDQNETVIATQSSLARGITAERSGSSMEAISHYLQAAALDPSSVEIKTRLNNTSRQVFTGDLKSGLQNEIQQKRAWLQILNDCAKAYDNIIPFQLVIERLQIGKVDLVKETQEFSVRTNLWAIRDSTKLLENVLEEYLKIGYEKMLAYGFIDQYLKGWPIENSPSNAKLPAFHKDFRPWPWPSGEKKEMRFNIVIALVNENGKEFRQDTTLIGEIHRNLVINNNPYKIGDFGPNEFIKHISHSSLGQYSFGYVIRDEKGVIKGNLVHGFLIKFDDSKLLKFNIPADDLTNKYTIKLISINGIDADTIALNGYMRVLMR